jgi:hypothetical protein
MRCRDRHDVNGYPSQHERCDDDGDYLAAARYRCRCQMRQHWRRPKRRIGSNPFTGHNILSASKKAGLRLRTLRARWPKRKAAPFASAVKEKKGAAEAAPEGN